MPELRALRLGRAASDEADKSAEPDAARFYGGCTRRNSSGRANPEQNYRSYRGEIDLLKVDIEGSEYEVLFNTDTKHLKRVRRMVLEYHGDVEPYTHAQLFARLASNGFEVVSDDHDKLNYGVVEMVRRSE